MKTLMVIAIWLLHLVAAAPGRVYAQCEPVTSYIPVTTTVTVTALPSAEFSASNGPLLRTSTSTATSTPIVSAAFVSSKQITFSFVVESGRTTWFGATPSADMSLSTVTTTFDVFPSGAASSSPDTTVATVTIEPPPYVSTSFSMVNPTTTSTVYKTKTTTTVVTHTVTRVRTAFSSPGSSGWNVTGTPTADLTSDAAASSEDGIPTTITDTVYWSLGSKITSTSVTTLTLTLTRSRTSTLTLTPSPSRSTVHSLSSSPESTLSGMPLSTSSATLTSPSSLLSLPLTLAETTTSIVQALSPLTLSSTSTYVVPASFDGSVNPTDTSSQGLSAHGSSSKLEASSQTLIASLSSAAVFSRSVPGHSTSSSTPSTGASVGLATASRQVSAASESRWSYSISASQALSNAAASSSATVGPASKATAATGSLLISAGSASRLLSSPQMSSVASLSVVSRQTSSVSSISAQVTSLQEPTIFATPSSSSQSARNISSSSIDTTSSAISALLTSAPSRASTIAGSAMSQSPTFISSSQLANISASADASEIGETISATSTRTATSVNTATLSTSDTASPTAAGTSVSSPTPSTCGEHGNFTLNFDDLPSFMPNQSVDITQAPPVFNGYHHMAFSNGYVYAPPPDAPYSPVSQPHLAVFLGNASGNGTNNTPTAMAPISGMIRPGEFGNGVSDSVSAFWFNAYSAWLGCDNSGPQPCTYVVTAYAWNNETLKEEQIDSQTLTTPACPGFNGCRLQQVALPSTFHGLSGLQIQAYKGPDQVMFFMDDVQLGWYNNTCAAGLQRLRSPRSGPLMRRHARLPKQ